MSELDKALEYLVKKFGLEKEDFKFHAVWRDKYVNCILFNVINEKSKWFKSTVAYPLSS